MTAEQQLSAIRAQSAFFRAVAPHFEPKPGAPGCLDCANGVHEISGHPECPCPCHGKAAK